MLGFKKKFRRQLHWIQKCFLRIEINACPSFLKNFSENQSYIVKAEQITRKFNCVYEMMPFLFALVKATNGEVEYAEALLKEGNEVWNEHKKNNGVLDLSNRNKSKNESCNDNKEKKSSSSKDSKATHTIKNILERKTENDSSTAASLHMFYQTFNHRFCNEINLKFPTDFSFDSNLQFYRAFENRLNQYSQNLSLENEEETPKNGKI